MKAYYTRLKLLYMKTAVEHHLRWSFLSSGDSAGTWRQLAPPIPIISAKKFSDSFVMNHNSTLVIIPVGAIFPSLTEWYYPFLRWRLLFDVECHFLPIWFYSQQYHFIWPQFCVWNYVIIEWGKKCAMLVLPGQKSFRSCNTYALIYYFCSFWFITFAV